MKYHEAFQIRKGSSGLGSRDIDAMYNGTGIKSGTRVVDLRECQCDGLQKAVEAAFKAVVDYTDTWAFSKTAGWIDRWYFISDRGQGTAWHEIILAQRSGIDYDSFRVFQVAVSKGGYHANEVYRSPFLGRDELETLLSLT